MIYTTKEAAQELGLAERTVRKWCSSLGVRKLGRDYAIDEPSMRRIREAAQDKPGRPIRTDR